MSETPAVPNPSDMTTAQKMDAEKPQKKKKKHRILKAFLLLLVLLIVLVAVAPMIISSSSVVNSALGNYNDTIRGRIELDDLSLAWFSPAEVRGLRIYDPEDRLVVSLDIAKTPKGLFGTLTNRRDLGEFVAMGPAVDLYLDEDGKASLARAFEPRETPKPKAPQQPRPKKPEKPKEPGTMPNAADLPFGSLRIENARVTAHRPDGATLTIGDGQFLAGLDADGKINVNFSFTPNDQPRIAGDASVAGLLTGNELSLATLAMTGKIDSAGKIQLASFANFLQIEGLAGDVNLHASAKTEGGKVAFEHRFTVDGLVAPGQDPKGLRPLTVELSGNGVLALATEMLDLEATLASEAGENKFTFHGNPRKLVEQFASLYVADFTETGKLPPLPEMLVTFQGSNSIPALQAAVPALLHIQKGVTLTEGTLAFRNIAISGGAAPSATGGISLAGLAGTRKGKAVRVSPIVLDFDASQAAGGVLTLQKCLLQMGSAGQVEQPLSVTASGTMDSAVANYQIDLDRLMGELGQVFDVGDVQIAGGANGRASLVRKPGDKLEVALFTNWKEVTIAKPAEEGEEAPDPVVISTQVNWSGTLDATNPLSHNGNAKVIRLNLVSGKTKFEQRLLTVDYGLAFDEVADTLTIAKFALTSSPDLLLVPTLTGTISDFSDQKILDLSGHYVANFPRIYTLLDQLGIKLSDSVTLATKSESDFEVAGTAADPALDTMSGNTKFEWQSGEAVGLAIGPATLAPSLANGTLTLPESSFSAAEGTATIRATVLSKPADIQAVLPAAGDKPLLSIPGKLQVLKDAQLNAKFSKDVLSRVNPLFSKLVKIEGLVSLDVQDLAVPLDADTLKKAAAGSGRLDLSNVKITPDGGFATLAGFAGLPKDKPLPLTITGADFKLVDGGVEYDEMDMVFGETFDMRFRGRVGFDDTVDMVVSIPVRAGLLEKLGVGGKMLDYAKQLEGARVEIPITGTRNSPNIDLGKVDVKALLKNLTPDLLDLGKEKLPGLLEQFGDRAKPKPDADPNAPAKEPAGDLLRDALDQMKKPKEPEPDGGAQPEEKDPTGDLLRGALDQLKKSQEKEPAPAPAP